MKKIIALLLIVTMLLGLTGCAALKEKAQQKLEERLAALPYGEIEGDIYASEKAGIRFVKPVGWYYFTEEELTTLQEKSDEADAPVYDMFAMNAATGERVVIMYQVSDVGDSSIMESVYTKLLKEVLESTSEEELEFDAVEKTTLGETEFRKMKGVAADSLQTIYLHIEKEYISMILIQTSDAEALAQLEAQFDEDTAILQTKAPITQGSYEGETYKSDFAGLTFEKPADWSYMSSSEMANEMGLAGNALSVENYVDTYASQGYIYDMYAVGESGSAYVYLEDLASTGLADETAYLASLEQELLADEEVLYTKKEESTLTLGGQNYRRTAFSGDYEGVTVWQAYYAKSVDGVVCVAIITALSEAELAEVEACFK